MTIEEILAAARKCVCGDREQDYGSPERSFGGIGQFWETYLQEKCLEPRCGGPPGSPDLSGGRGGGAAVLRAREDIIRALRCSASTGDKDCTGCPYLIRGEFEGFTWESCDCDRMAVDAAEMLETDARTISALIEDRKNWMERYEKLKSLVPLYNFVPPDEA